MIKIPHFAFSTKTKPIARELATEIIVENPLTNKNINVKGIWDTGATNSVISERVFNTLQLNKIDTIPVSGVNSINHIAIVTVVNLLLPNGLRIPDIRLTVDKIAGTDVLIGMDVISMGDLAISNINNETLFSFAIPPFENPTDLLEKANRMNNRNRKHFPPNLQNLVK